MRTRDSRTPRFLSAVILGLCLLSLSPGLAAVPEPVLVADINPAPAVGSTPLYLTAVGDTLFFVADDGVIGDELWKADQSGTGLVKDIAPLQDPLIPNSLQAFNGMLFFTANDGSGAGEELWRSDGTITGTVMLKDINPSNDSDPSRFKVSNGILFFQATDGLNGYELWKSDGTPDGTVMVKDINPGSASSSPTILTNLNGTLFFLAVDGVHGEELWRSDGTPGGTSMVKDIYPGEAVEVHRSLLAVGNTLFFRADDGVHGGELWKTDGSEAGTVMVKDILSGAGSSSLSNLASLDDKVLFRADDGSHGAELWSSDGSVTGTLMVKDIAPGLESSEPNGLITADHRIYFSAYHPSTGRELWKSDGSEAGTLLVKDINVSGNSTPLGLLHTDGAVFFRATEGDHGAEFWKSNGTDVSTVLVKDINPGALASNPDQFTLIQDTLYFVANDGQHGRELWSLDLQNTPPAAEAGAGYAGIEGSPVSLAGSAIDESGPVYVEWTTQHPECSFPDPHLLLASLICSDDGVFTVTLQILDWWNVSATDQATVTIDNAAPQIVSLSLSAEPALIGEPLEAVVLFTDPGQADTHTAVIDWGEGLSQDMPVDQGADSAAASHSYSATGDFTISVTVQDDDGAVTEASVDISVVENPPERFLFMPIIVR